jgi:hypothetical protein
MKLRACKWEAEVKQLLELGHWPHSCSDELRAHVAKCRACSDQVLLTMAFGAARAQSAAAACPPPASVLWWRAQLRRRDEAVKRIQRPLLGAQLFAFAVAIALLSGTMVYQAIHGLAWVTVLTDWLAVFKHWPFASAEASISMLYLVPGAAMLLLLSGVVIYLATEKQ